jgi:hypothetical protein
MNDLSSPRKRRIGRRAVQGTAALVLAVGSMTAFGAASANAAPTIVSYGAGTHTLHLPAGPVTVNFTIIAGGGGADGDLSSAGGFGGGIVGSFVWSGKATNLKVIVGKAGANGRAAGKCPTYFQYPAFHTGTVAGHGGAGGVGGKTGLLTCAGAGGFGGGATAVQINYATVLVAGGGGGASSSCEGGVDGTGTGSVKGLVAGGNGHAGSAGQEGGGGGGGSAVKAAGGASGVCGSGGTGYAHSSGSLVLGPLVTGTSSGLFGGSPGVDGQAQFVGVGIS